MHDTVPVHLVGGVVGEDEGPGVVVADAALILHLAIDGLLKPQKKFLLMAVPKKEKKSADK